MCGKSTLSEVLIARFYTFSSSNESNTEKNKYLQEYMLKSLAPQENEYGETPLPGAPTCESLDGLKVVPQQFLDVDRTLKSVERILNKISVPSPFLLFAGQQQSLVYLVCAVVGHENYPTKSAQALPAKIVYGRRWFLESSTPTSEVIQTALLAVKKAKEHELRESFKLKVVPNSSENDKSVTTTPFNCHHDLPLMAVRRAQFEQIESEFNLVETLELVKVDGLSLRLLETKNLSVGGTLYSIELGFAHESPKLFKEFLKKSIVFVCAKNTKADFLHSLFDALLVLSDAEVDEAFAFDGFSRFSRRICPTEIGDFSHETRNLSLSISEGSDTFLSTFEDMSYRIDSTKAPVFNADELGAKQRLFLRGIEEQSGSLVGYLPKEPEIKMV